ncbi:MAG: hypothetical protein NW226_17995 [Microscillaceae bacterium]|nr:hypothetical protein [Microscillaceae bacterium]
MEKPLILQGINTLEQRLKKSDRVFTLGDAAAITGFALDEAKETLDALMVKYDCRLKVTENGDLIYDFGKILHPRGERTWAEWWYGTKQWLWKAFMIVFKAWISITLVVYFVLFLVILIAFVVAMMAKNDDNSSSSDSDFSGVFIFIGDIFRSIFFWNTVTGSTYYDRDPYGYPYQRYEPRPSSFNKKKKGKNFVASVYDFVFGPPRVEQSALANQQEVAAYLRKNKGLIVIPEIIGLAGWKADEAEDFFTDVIVRYKGDSKISENNVLYGDFYELARTQTSEADAKVVWYWDEYEPEYKLTGNTAGRNAGVIFMNLFNLFFSLIFLAGANSPELAGDSAGILIFLGWIPFIFSVLFFGVPLMRYFQIQPLQRKRHLNNIRKRLMKVIYHNASSEVPLSYLEQNVNAQNKGEEKLSRENIEQVMNQLIRDLDGEIDQNERGEIIYRFPRLIEEMQEVARLRNLRESGRNLGNIVFDSHG